MAYFSDLSGAAILFLVDTHVATASSELMVSFLIGLLQKPG